MQELTKWWKSRYGSDGAPWLLLGKGPTFARSGEFDLAGYRTVALNHVVRELPVDIASAIDIDVVSDCADAIRRNAKFLMVPRHPHVKNKATGRKLEDFFNEIPVLKEFSEQGKLIWYNLGPDHPEEGAPIYEYGMFSAEVVTKILAQLGVKKIRTLGVDGGTKYAGTFKDFEGKRLNNDQATFNTQFMGIASAIWKHNLDFGPLVPESPMRIFIGCDESQVLGAKIFEYSVRKRSSITAVCDDMLLVDMPWPKDPKNQPRTQFSFKRFVIPALMGYKGRAVYVDADMQVLRDFRGMWETDFAGATVLHCAPSSPERPKQFSVLLLDCNRLKWDIKEIVAGLDRGDYDYDKLMKHICIEPPENVREGLSSDWNSLEEYTPGKTGLIHYTDMHTQPWVSRKNKNGDLWLTDLRSALKEGFVSRDELHAAAQKGYLRPSLMMQLKIPRRLWPSFTKLGAGLLDRRFKPHQALATRLEAAKPKA